MSTSIQSAPTSTFAPASRSFASTASRWAGARADDAHATAGDRAGDQERAGLDAVRQHAVLAAAEPLDALDHDRVGAGARDLRAHRVEAGREVDDLGLARGVLDQRAAARERRRHHEVLGAGDGHGVLHDARALQAPGLRLDVAVLDRDLGAQRLQAGDVQVDRARADRAAAGQRDAASP